MTESVFENRRAPRKRTLDDDGVARLKRRPVRYEHPDPEMIGHLVRVMPDGPPHSFIARERNPFQPTEAQPHGRSVWPSASRATEALRT
jgi:hypothetical protein